MSPRPAALALCLVALLGACSGQVTQESATQFSARQIAAAQRAEAGGDLAGALTLWRSVLTLHRAGGTAAAVEARREVQRLQEEIRRRADSALSRAEAAYAGGKRRQGDHAMLTVLALRPEDPAATAALRESFTGAAQARLAAKLAQEAAPAPEGGTPAIEDAPAEAPAESAAAGAHAGFMRQADAARERGDRALELDRLLAAQEGSAGTDNALAARIEAVRQALAEQWYQKGVGLIQRDLPAAIEALEKALVYDPGHRGAEVRLRQAEQLRVRLEKIRQAG